MVRESIPGKYTTRSMEKENIQGGQNIQRANIRVKPNMGNILRENPRKPSLKVSSQYDSNILSKQFIWTA